MLVPKEIKVLEPRATGDCRCWRRCPRSRGAWVPAGAYYLEKPPGGPGVLILVARMKPGSVVVDVAIDQGGCFETSRPTTHAEPVYVVDGVTHYCVANMPGGVPRTSTFALNNATLPFVMALAEKGWQRALREDPHLRNGLDIARGQVCCAPVAAALGYAHVEASGLL